MTKDNGRLPVGTGPSSVPDRAAEGAEPSAEDFQRMGNSRTGAMGALGRSEVRGVKRLDRL
jgi:hypothetical protein